MIQGWARERAEEAGAKKPKRKGNTHCVAVEPLKNIKAQATSALREIVKQDVRNSEGTGTVIRAGSHVYDCICKILLKGIRKKLCESRWEGKTEEFPGMPRDLCGVSMWSMSFGLLYRKLWSWWPLSALKIYECVISKIALKISPKRLYSPFVSFIINWKDSPLERSFFFSAILPFFPIFHLNPAAVTDADITSCVDSFRHSISLLPI